MQRGWRLRLVSRCVKLILFCQILTAEGSHHRKQLAVEKAEAYWLQKLQHKRFANSSNYREYPNRDWFARYPYFSDYTHHGPERSRTNTNHQFPGRQVAYSDGLPNPRIPRQTDALYGANRNSFSFPVAQGKGKSPGKQTEAKYADEGNGFSFPVIQGKGLYRAEIQIGTPAQKLLVEVDTGSDLTWVKCRSAVSYDGEFGNQIFFNPNNSSTFEMFHKSTLFDHEETRTFSAACESSDRSNFEECTFFQRYADGSFAGGGLVTEMLALHPGSSTEKDENLKVPLTVGCERSSSGDFETGLLGLGRGMLSLPAQIGDHYSNSFGYCFSTENQPNSSFLRFGDAAYPSVPGMKFLSLILNSKHPSFYYLNLAGLTIGGEQLQLPPGVFSIDPENGNGGVVLDTGTTYTFLPPVAYEMLAAAFEDQMDVPRASPSVRLHRCFQISVEDQQKLLIPRLILHFQEEDDRIVDIELPIENYFKQVSPDKFCLAVLPTHGPPGVSAVIGNMWQRNFHVLINITNSSIGFLGPKVCNEVQNHWVYDSIAAYHKPSVLVYVMLLALGIYVIIGLAMITTNFVVSLLALTARRLRYSY